jgi:hypothetical protein
MVQGDDPWVSAKHDAEGGIFPLEPCSFRLRALQLLEPCRISVADEIKYTPYMRDSCTHEPGISA